MFAMQGFSEATSGSHTYYVERERGTDSIIITDSNGKEVNYIQGNEAYDFVDEITRIEAIDDEKPDMGFLYNWIFQYDINE